MTAVNFVLSKSQIFIATDSLVSGQEQPGHGTKAFALPHLRLVIAGMGHGFLSISLKTELVFTPLVDADVDDLAEIAADIARKKLAAARAVVADVRHTAYLFGFTRDHVARAYWLSAEHNFEPRQIHPDTCTYLHPGLQTETPTAIVRRPSGDWGAPADFVRNKDDANPWAWTDAVILAVSAIGHQAKQNPQQIGGRVLCTHMTPGQIIQTWRDLPQADT